MTKSSSVLNGLSGRDRQSDWRALKDRDWLELRGLVAGVLQKRLQDDVRNIDPHEEVTVGPGVRDFRPAKGAAAAGLVVDDDLAAKVTLEQWLLAARLAIALAPRIERHQVGELPAGKVRGGAAVAGRDRHQGEQANDRAHGSPGGIVTEDRFSARNGR